MNVPDILARRRMLNRFAGRDCAPGARVNAFAAFFDARTSHGNPAELRMKLLGFRTVAPGASQGASLQKNRRPDSGAVLHGKALDIVDFSGQLFFHFGVYKHPAMVSRGFAGGFAQIRDRNFVDYKFSSVRRMMSSWLAL
jgi:hypothetical protein